MALNKAYNHYSQQDMPEQIFDVLFNHSLSDSSKVQLNKDQTRAEKDETHQQLSNIIQINRTNQTPIEKWIPGSIQYPPIIIQLLRARFPSPEIDTLLPDSRKYSLEEFILYTCK